MLEKKPELIKVLEDRKEKNKKKELDAYLKTKRSSFEAKLEEQANKLNLVRSLFFLKISAICMIFQSKSPTVWLVKMLIN